MMSFTGWMKNKYRIALGISLALTFFFALPWISLMGEAQYLQVVSPAGNAGGRLIFLAVTVFFTSLLFFQYNLFWKDRWNTRQPVWLRNTLNLLVNLMLVLIVSILVNRSSTHFFGLRKTFFTFYIFRNLLIAFVSMLVAYVYDVMEQSKQDRIKLLMLNTEKVESELARLKNQLSPHFLFNCLNSLTGVIRENQKEAIHFVNHLSETFRYMLEHRQNNLVPVHYELVFLDSYLYMMNARFGKGLRVRIDVAEAYWQKKVPQFGLQLLVENAIKHNVVSERRPLIIQITANKDSIEVSNSLQLKSQSAEGYGIGLASLAKHYELLGKSPIEVVKTEYEFYVTLPLL